MLRVVQIAAWDCEPPHMSGYPHLPPPRHHSTRRLMPTVNPSNRTTKTRSGTPIRRCCWPSRRLRRMTCRRGAPAFPALWRTPLRNVRAARASTEGATWPVHRCGTDQEVAWAAAEPTRLYFLRCGFQRVVCTEP